MSQDWTDTGNEISTMGELSEFVSLVLSEVHHMRVGLARAAWGALNGRPWIKHDDPREFPNDEDILRSLDMTVTPAGTSAKDAALRQSLAALITSLEAADRAALTVWLAQVAAKDPERKA